MLAQISADPGIQPAAIASRLGRLLDAPAPANSCLLPGTVGDVIRAIASELDLTCAPIGSSGNLGIEIGNASAPLDLVVCAHMDRPCFRVLSLRDSTLYPLCAVRVPGERYTCEGVALHFEHGRMVIGARGKLHFLSSAGDQGITFAAETGELRWGDTIMMRCQPRFESGFVIGTGLDNAIGVLIALLCAHMLKKYAADNLAERRVLFAFTDQEEGPPDGLFGQGAARLAHVLAPPRLGFINIDGHNRDEANGHIPGVGASHAFVSGSGRGSVVPMDFQALTEGLARDVNHKRTGAVRLNHSYVSRSDDMLLSFWARCLGLIGVVVENAHTTEETACIADIVSAAHWLPAFAARLLMPTN